MTSANPTLPRPPAYYFKPIKIEPQPLPLPEQLPEQNNSHQQPDMFEPPAKRNFRKPTPYPSNIPSTPSLQTPMKQSWLLDPMP